MHYCYARFNLPTIISTETQFANKVKISFIVVQIQTKDGNLKVYEVVNYKSRMLKMDMRKQMRSGICGFSEF